MKEKFRKKDIRLMAAFHEKKLVKVGYCNLQFLLKFREPFGYSTRAEGWACDYYSLDKFIISTGYAPIGMNVDYDTCRKYDQKAARILGNNWSWKRQRAELDKLIAKFEEEIL